MADVPEGRFRLASPATANVLAILVVALFIAALPLAAVTGNLTVSSAGANIATIPVFLAYGAVGVVVARRQPRNPMGWILLGFAVLLAASNCAGAYAALVYRLGHGALPLGPAAVLLDLLWVPAIVLGSLATLLFPDGTLPSPAWRWVLRGLPGDRRLLAGEHLRRRHRHDRRGSRASPVLTRRAGQHLHQALPSGRAAPVS